MQEAAIAKFGPDASRFLDVGRRTRQMVDYAKTVELTVTEDVAVGELDGTRVSIRKTGGSWLVDPNDPVPAPAEVEKISAAAARLAKGTDEVVARIERGDFPNASAAFAAWSKEFEAMAEGGPNSNRVARVKTDVLRIASDGVEAFKVMRGRYPTAREGLQLLLEEKFLKPNSADGKLKDPWGREYVYVIPGKAHPDSYDVMSYGADGQPGGAGENADIVNE